MTSTAELFAFCSHPSVYLAKVQMGDTVILTDAGCRIAEIAPIETAQRSKEPRPFGLGKGGCTAPDSFFDPLPEDIIEAFEGGSDDPLRTALRAQPSGSDPS